MVASQPHQPGTLGIEHLPRRELVNRTRFNVPKMDCAAEASMVRLAVDALPSVRRLDIDLSTRTVDVYHEGPADSILAKLEPLNLGTAILVSTPTAGHAAPEMSANGKAEAYSLRLVLAINAVMFVAKSVGGYLADSSALIADSLDMFADAAVYAGASRVRPFHSRANTIAAVAGIGQPATREASSEAMPPPNPRVERFGLGLIVVLETAVSFGLKVNQ